MLLYKAMNKFKFNKKNPSKTLTVVFALIFKKAFSE